MSQTKKPLLLYVHIPYCVQPERYQKRYYSVGSNAEKNSYMAALKKEILSYEGELPDHEIAAVWLGGGSATVMSPDLLGSLLRTIRSSLPVRKGVEISVDAHPLTIGTPALTGIASGKPTRMELMMRSYQDDELKTLQCAFTSQHIRNAHLFFNRFHMNNLGMTVDFGIPGQTNVSWHNTLHACVIMHPAHITIEPVALEKLPIDPDHLSALYTHACDYLTSEGYLQYTATHFCLPHHGHLYELLRTEGTEYLGVGVGAVSMFDGYLTRNVNNRHLYIRNAGDFEKTTAQAYTLDDVFCVRDYVSCRLRTTEGLSAAAFEAKFGKTLPGEIREDLERRMEGGLLTEENGIYRPTPQGLLYAALSINEDR